jgi:hypothetical protein
MENTNNKKLKCFIAVACLMATVIAPESAKAGLISAVTRDAVVVAGTAAVVSPDARAYEKEHLLNARNKFLTWTQNQKNAPQVVSPYASNLPNAVAASVKRGGR